MASTSPVSPFTTKANTPVALADRGGRAPPSTNDHDPVDTRVANTRMSYDQATIPYIRNRQTEIESRREILRCLKRYVAREFYHLLTNPLPLFDNHRSIEVPVMSAPPWSDTLVEAQL